MPAKPSLPRKRNPMAKDLIDPRFRQRVVKKRKGKGSYERKDEKEDLRENPGT